MYISHTKQTHFELYEKRIGFLGLSGKFICSLVGLQKVNMTKNSDYTTKWPSLLVNLFKLLASWKAN